MKTHPETVTLFQTSNNVWRMSVKGGNPQGPSDYPVLKVPPGDDGTFTFQIMGSSKATFSGDPIYIQKGCAKPASGVDPQIQDITGQNTTTLKFKNLNTDVGPLTYVLNFSDGTHADPIIENGGRPPPPPPPPPPTSGTAPPHKAYLGYVGGFDLGAVLIGLIIGFIIAFILCRSVRRKAEAMDYPH